MSYLGRQIVPEMRETQFVRQNQEKWQAFERVLDQPRPDPQAVGDLFVQLTDDLAYARTFYPNRSVRVYLNGLTRRAFNTLHRTKQHRRDRFVRFWTHELPLLVDESRRAFRLAGFVFLVAVLIGIVSSAAVPEFLESILGADYVEMTRENIESGDPMAVYKQRGELDMTLSITFNNVLVALRTFVMGALFMVGSIFILLFNGVMLGSFEYFFYENGLLGESLLTVFMHGALEISAIVIAGAAGLTLGRGLVFPGTYRRLRAFQLSARRGIKIMAGTVPLFVLAGFIEGFITRYTGIPDPIRAVFILACFAFILGYFVWLPVYRARRHTPDAVAPDVPLDPDRAVYIERREVKRNGQLFVDAFQLFRRHAGFLTGLAAAGAALHAAVYFLASPNAPAQSVAFESNDFGAVLVELADYLIPSFSYGAMALAALLFGGLLAAITLRLGRFLHPSEAALGAVPAFWTFTHTLTAAVLLYGLLWLDSGWVHLLVLLLPVFALLPPFVGLRAAERGEATWPRAWALAFTQYGTWLSLGFSFHLFSVAAFLLFDTSLFTSLVRAVLANFSFEATVMQHLGTVLLSLLVGFVFFLLVALWMCGAAVYHLSVREVREAGGLHAAVERVGTQRRIKGMLRE